MRKKILYYLLGLLFPAISFSQDITGVWKGELYVDSTKKYYPFELTISEDKGKLTGYSRISFEEKGIRQVVFRDHKIRMQADSIIIEDDNQLAKASSVSQPKEVKKIMIVVLTKKDSTMQLSGRWSTNKTRHYLSASGSVRMDKKIDFKKTEIFKKLDSLSLSNKLSFNKSPAPVVEPPKEKVEEETAKLTKILLAVVKKTEPVKKGIAKATVSKPPKINIGWRPVAIISNEPATPVTAIANPPIKNPVVIATKNEPVVKNDKPVSKSAEKKNILPEQKNAAVDVSKRSVNNMQELFFKSDSLQLTLYDNGEIDGDTVSVLLNGKVIIAKKGLDTKPNVYTIYFDKDTPDSQMLVMYAENLGSIPPNTGLLVVKEGRSVYEVRFSADLKTNAAVILRRKKDE